MSNDIKLQEALLKTRLNNERAERNRNIRLKNRENILSMYNDGLLTMEERNAMLISFWCITDVEVKDNKLVIQIQDVLGNNLSIAYLGKSVPLGTICCRNKTILYTFIIII